MASFPFTAQMDWKSVALVGVDETACKVSMVYLMKSGMTP